MVFNKLFFFFYNNFSTVGFRARPRLKQATPLPRSGDSSLRPRLKEEESMTPDDHDHHLALSTLEGESTCCVCLSSIGRDGEEAGRSVLPCLHEFHKVCVDRWFKECRRTCPICRYSMEGIDENGSNNHQMLTDEMVIWFSSFHTSGF